MTPLGWLGRKTSTQTKTNKYIHVKLWYKRWVFQTYNTNNVQWTNTSMSVIQEVSVSDIQYQQYTMDRFIRVRLWYKRWVFDIQNQQIQWTNTSMSDCDTRGECFRQTIPTMYSGQIHPCQTVIQEVSVSDIQYQQYTMDKFIHVRLWYKRWVFDIQYQQYTMDKYIHVRLWYKRWVFQTYNTNNVQWTNTSISDCDTRGECVQTYNINNI